MLLPTMHATRKPYYPKGWLVRCGKLKVSIQMKCMFDFTTCIKTNVYNCHSDIAKIRGVSSLLNRDLQMARENVELVSSKSLLHFNCNSKSKIDKNLKNFESSLELSKASYLKWKAGDASVGEVIKCLKKSVAINPNSTEALYRLGFMQIEAGKITAAIKSLEKAIEVDPNFAEAHNSLGWALWKRLQSKTAHSKTGSKKIGYDNRELTKIVDHFRKAILFKPDYANAHNNLGCVLVETGSFEEGVEILKNCFLSNAEDCGSTVHYNLAIAYGELKNFNASLAHYKTAIFLDPSNAKIINNYALCLANFNQHSDAIEWFKRAIELSPKEADFYGNLALTHLKCDHLIDAIKVYEQALFKNPLLDRFWTELGSLYQELEIFVEKKKIQSVPLEPLVLQDAYNPEHTLHDLSVCKQYEVKHEARTDYFYVAYLCYAKSLQINSQLPATYKGLGVLYAHLESWLYAQHYFEKFLSYSPDNAEVLTHLGNALRQQGDLSRCVELWKKAVKIDSKYAPPRQCLAQYYAEVESDWPKSIEYLEKIVFDNPQDVVAKLNLAIASHYAGRRESSKRLFQELLKEDSDNHLVHYNYVVCLLDDNGNFEEKIAHHMRVIESLNPEFYHSRFKCPRGV